MSIDHQEVFLRLKRSMGSSCRSPADDPLEVLVETALIQNSTRPNVERATANLKEAGLLDVKKLCRVSDDELAELIRPAGHVRPKVRRLKNLMQFVDQQYDGVVDAMPAVDRFTLRESLISLNGIGPETADLVLLYAMNKPSFAVDAGIARIIKRHGWIEFEADYYAMSDLFEGALNSDAECLREYHSLLATVGRDYCGKRPRCEACPLRDLLPEGGPLEPDEF